VRAILCSAVLLAASLQPAVRPPSQQRIERHFTPADRESGRYQYLPFDVPDGIESIAIGYEYDGRNGASVIDLGLFEPGPVALGSTAFRGYSGGAQKAIVVGRESASPGYRAGGVPAGTWHILLGLYRVAPEGVDVRVSITLTPRSTVPQGRWYSGALHLHTTHSDGAMKPSAVAELARSAGLDFIAITDHNNTFHPREAMPAAPLHIVGEEVTTPAGHASVWGLKPGSFIDFRVSPNDVGAAGAIDGFVAQAHAAAALFSINHPFDDCAGCSWEQAIPAALDAIEIWNGERGPQERAIALWDRLLQSGRHVTAVGASDWHRPPSPIDAAAVRVWAESLSERALLDSIRRGRVVVVRNAAQPVPSMAATCGSSRAEIGGELACGRSDSITVTAAVADASNGSIVDLLWNGAVRESRPATSSTTFTMTAAAGYLRVHLRGADGSLSAITNPIHVVLR
jgi:hypothetical protein